VKVELKSIGLWSFVKIAFFVNLIMGFLVGLLHAPFLGMIMSLAASGYQGYDEFGGGFGDVSIGALLIILPIAFAFGGGVIYTLFELVIVVLYNLVARVTGGMEFDLSGIAKAFVTQPVQTPPQAAPLRAQTTVPPPPPYQTPPSAPPPEQSPPPDSPARPAPSSFAPENRPPTPPAVPSAEPPRDRPAGPTSSRAVPPVPGTEPPKLPEPPPPAPDKQEPPRE